MNPDLGWLLTRKRAFYKSIHTPDLDLGYLNIGGAIGLLKVRTLALAGAYAVNTLISEIWPLSTFVFNVTLMLSCFLNGMKLVMMFVSVGRKMYRRSIRLLVRPLARAIST